MKFTVFGGRGFIGSHLVRHLERSGHSVFVPARDAKNVADQHLGHVVYAIGLTGDFRSRTIETIDAHVNVLAQLLSRSSFDSWLYLSSTRVYASLPDDQPASEDMAIPIVPSGSAIYDLSKLLGEALCLAIPASTVRVARLSNVYGRGMGTSNFLGSVLEELRERGAVVIGEAPGSSKDYVSLEYVLRVVEAIAARGQHRVYNIARGVAVSHAEIADRLGAVTGASVRFAEHATRRTFPRIDVTRISTEFGNDDASLLDSLATLLQNPAP